MPDRTNAERQRRYIARLKAAAEGRISIKTMKTQQTKQQPWTKRFATIMVSLVYDCPEALTVPVITKALTKAGYSDTTAGIYAYWFAARAREMRARENEKAA